MADYSVTNAKEHSKQVDLLIREEGGETSDLISLKISSNLLFRSCISPMQNSGNVKK